MTAPYRDRMRRVRDGEALPGVSATLLPGHTPDETGSLTCPDVTGGTNFWPPTFDPSTQTFFVNAREVCATFYAWKPDYVVGERFTGGAAQRTATLERPAVGALRAIDPATGERKWEFKTTRPSLAGTLSTGSGLVFSGDMDGNIFAVDAKTGRQIWSYQTGAAIYAAPITYSVDGKQYVLLGSGTTLTAYALPVQ